MKEWGELVNYVTGGRGRLVVEYFLLGSGLLSPPPNFSPGVIELVRLLTNTLKAMTGANINQAEEMRKRLGSLYCIYGLKEKTDIQIKGLRC